MLGTISELFGARYKSGKGSDRTPFGLRPKMQKSLGNGRTNLTHSDKDQNQVKNQLLSNRIYRLICT